MKNLLLALCLLAMVVLVSTQSMNAGEMAAKGQWGIQTSLGIAAATVAAAPTIGAKFMLTDQVAIRAELGFGSVSPGGGAPSNSGYGIGAGFEYHMTPHGDVSPYAGLQLGYGGGSVGGGGTAPSNFSVAGVFGGEYFFSGNFSMGGEVGLGFKSSKSGVAGAASASSFGTFGVGGAIFTWYLN